MKIPSKIKIGNLLYTVGPIVDSEGSHFGKSSQAEQKIWLSSKMSPELRTVVFWHEVIHQILDQGSYSEESKNEKH